MKFTPIFQIPLDLVVKFQRIDIAGVILWLVLPPHIVYPREIKGSAAPHPLKAAVPAKEAGLLPLPRLRTGRESFPSSGSSISKAV